MDGHRPEVWCSDRYAARQGHTDAHQACLAHLARDVAYAIVRAVDAIGVMSRSGCLGSDDGWVRRVR